MPDADIPVVLLTVGVQERAAQKRFLRIYLSSMSVSTLVGTGLLWSLERTPPLVIALFVFAAMDFLAVALFFDRFSPASYAVLSDRLRISYPWWQWDIRFEGVKEISRLTRIEERMYFLARPIVDPAQWLLVRHKGVIYRAVPQFLAPESSEIFLRTANDALAAWRERHEAKAR